MNKISVLLTVALFATAFKSIKAERTFMELFESTTAEGSLFSMKTSYNEPDLDSYHSLNWADEEYHWISYNGGWLTYDGPDFTDYGWWIDYCESNCSGIISSAKSVRFASAQSNASKSAFSIFNSTRWMGTQLTFETDQPNVTLPFRSTYRSGSDPWTLYLQPNYGGFSTCIRSNTIADISGLGVTPGDVKSIRKGCLSKNIVSEQDMTYHIRNKPHSNRRP